MKYYVITEDSSKSSKEGDLERMIDPSKVEEYHARRSDRKGGNKKHPSQKSTEVTIVADVSDQFFDQRSVGKIKEDRNAYDQEKSIFKSPMPIFINYFFQAIILAQNFVFLLLLQTSEVVQLNDPRP